MKKLWVILIFGDYCECGDGIQDCYVDSIFDIKEKALERAKNLKLSQDYCYKITMYIANDLGVEI